MTHSPTPDAPRRATRNRSAASGGPELPVGDPPPYSEPPPSTGTVDDDDEPEDEHDGENEASVRENSDDAETPEEIASGSDGAAPP